MFPFLSACNLMNSFVLPCSDCQKVFPHNSNFFFLFLVKNILVHSIYNVTSPPSCPYFYEHILPEPQHKPLNFEKYHNLYSLEDFSCTFLIWTIYTASKLLFEMLSTTVALEKLLCI